MNERTVELYKQATEFAYNSIGREHANTAYFQGAITGKFAELIVRECVGICLERHDSWKFDDESDSNSGPRDCAQMIEEHFGVEE
ncbi:MAG: hypothetical protein RI909_571 [Bacteroidota bacterium]|jgi:hypothetical protein